jgi:hypothetical protein
VKVLKGMALGFSGFFLFFSLQFLGFLITLNVSILNPDFVIREVEKLDATEVARTYLKDQLSNGDFLYASAIDTTLSQEKPWINQQIRQTIITSYDYLLGASDRLSYNFQLEEVKQSMSGNLARAVLNSPPPEYQKLSPQQKDQYILNLKKEIQEQIPSSYDLEINQTIVGADGMKLLQQIKEAIGYFKTVFLILIVFAVLMMLLIGLIQRKLSGISRVLGIIFLINGVLGGITYFILKLGIPHFVQLNELPTQVNSWLLVLINDCLAPVGMFSLIVLLTGVICLTASFMFKPRQDITFS